MAEVENLINEPSEAEKRIKQLSGKVKEEAEARVAAEANAKAQAEAKAAAQKEADFYKNFSHISGKYSGSAEKIEEIKSKVMAGYDLEDATISVVTRSQQATVQPTQAPIAGGSAATMITQKAEKSIADLSTEEKRARLMQLDDEIHEILYPPSRN